MRKLDIPRHPTSHRRDLILIRHGECEGNTRKILSPGLGDPLSKRGEAQAAKLRTFFTRYNNHSISVVSSPATRSLETATIVFPGKPIVRCDQLLEIDAGSFGDKSLEQLRDAAGRFSITNYVNERYPNGESYSDVFLRVKNWLTESIQGDIHDSMQVVFSHGGPIGILLHVLFDLPLERFPIFRIDTGSVTHVTISTVETQTVALINFVNHTLV
jgi:broad specificity phosphatase PhoE